MSSVKLDPVDPSAVYDYIICGGGTAGCVLAGRLASDLNATILVLEAGPHNENLTNVHMPAGASLSHGSAEQDWNIVGEPMDRFDGRQVKLTRGRFLGGSSGVNATLCIRGTEQDYDDWGLEEWTGEKMFGYMKKSETFHPKDWHKANQSVHGTDGPLHTEPHDLAPISERVKESMIEMGLPYYPDMFASGESAHGCGDATRTVFKGIRSTAADFITRDYRRSNVTILTEVTVDKLLLDESSGELGATGVVTMSKGGERVEYHARKEVIVTAGAYCSPIILMRSGIGPKEELEKHGIKCLVDLPGVGQNLMDHVLCFIFYEVSEPNLTVDAKAHHGDARALSMKQYQETKTGLLASVPFGIFGFARLDERLQDSDLWKNAKREPGRDPMGLKPNQPNIEFWNTEMYGGPKQYTDFPVDYKHAFSLCCMLFNQHSRGFVALKSADAKDNPVVDHNYLADPLDMLVMTEACRFANEIVVNGKGTKDIIKGSWPADLTHHTHTSREHWEPYVKKHATTCYHAAGTCAMGKSDDKNAVLDSRLRVRGVRNIRVADLSSVPVVNNGHTQMVAYGIGEGAAELIQEDARNDVGK